MIQPVLSQLRYPLSISFCKIQPKPVAANKTPSERPSTVRSRCNMIPKISFVPRMFPCACRFFAAICIIKIAMPSQNNVKNPWKGESALAVFCLYLLSGDKALEAVPWLVKSEGREDIIIPVECGKLPSENQVTELLPPLWKH